MKPALSAPARRLVALAALGRAGHRLTHKKGERITRDFFEEDLWYNTTESMK